MGSKAGCCKTGMTGGKRRKQSEVFVGRNTMRHITACGLQSLLFLGFPSAKQNIRRSMLSNLHIAEKRIRVLPPSAKPRYQTGTVSPA